ncbi:MAG TPA: 5-formyltetrahydrofolate cyclo-ligase [Kribbella sp.]|nr:5-formyltetrahydrofolate cyclo-ligase [Kribbella sp.]
MHPPEAAAEPPDPGVSRSKTDLRRDLLAARRTAAPLEQAFLAVAQAQLELVAARTVALYVSIPPEPSTGPLIDWLVTSGTEVLLPVLHDDNDLGWGIAPRPGGAGLVPGRFGLMQPPVDLGADAITRADLVICPALAVDRSGERLGRGGGSYDRALTRVPAGTPIWAMVYDTELLDSLPAHPHDRQVNAALTPTRLVRLARST